LQVEQELLLHVAQLEPPPATTLPPLEAKKTESMREVCLLSHLWQAIGSSASFIERIDSN